VFRQKIDLNDLDNCCHDGYHFNMNTPEEFEKIGATAIECRQQKNRWVFRRGDTYYDLAPAFTTELTLSPVILGIDRLIMIGSKLLNIKNPEDGCWLIFSENYFPKADVQFNFFEQKFDGWVYSVEEMNLKGLMTGQKAWICPYMKYFFKDAPQTIYIKIKEMEDGI
jgi:hypothetical protein